MKLVIQRLTLKQGKTGPYLVMEDKYGVIAYLFGIDAILVADEFILTVGIPKVLPGQEIFKVEAVPQNGYLVVKEI